LGERIADGDDYPELARLKTLIATFLEASGLRVGREADDAESNGVRFDERLAVRAPSPGSAAATLAPRVAAPEASHLVDLAATAHELRLPLSHIKGFVSSLRRADVTWDEETRSEFLAEIEIETDRLTQLVDSLLTASAREGTVDSLPELTLATPASVVEGGLHRIRGLLKLRARPLRLDVPPSLPPVWLDASRIERVLANLIQNAIKYSPPHTPIGVSARITHDGEFELSVDDEGPGIAVDDRQRIFEPFFRSQTTDQSKVHGHGLGLAICQAIVRAHGGRIQIFDRIGGGTRFSVFLPAQVRPGHLETKHHAKDQGNDSAEHSPSGRRGANAPASGQQSQGERLRREIGRRRPGSLEVARGAPVRPTAA
jgi:two-component system sensor histidine kinase KdpD